LKDVVGQTNQDKPGQYDYSFWFLKQQPIALALCSRWYNTLLAKNKIPCRARHTHVDAQNSLEISRSADVARVTRILGCYFWGTERPEAESAWVFA
jgi:hypothetical protein